MRTRTFNTRKSLPGRPCHGSSALAPAMLAEHRVLTTRTKTEYSPSLAIVYIVSLMPLTIGRTDRAEYVAQERRAEKQDSPEAPDLEGMQPIVVWRHVLNGREPHSRWRWIPVRPPARRRPLQDSPALLPHPPSTMMLNRMVSAAQMREVIRCRHSPERGIDSVIDVAARERDPTARESTMLVSRPQESAHLFTRPVPIHRHHFLGDLARRFCGGR